MYPASGLLSALGGNFAFECASWALVEPLEWVLSRCYQQLRQRGQKKEQALREEDTERRFEYGKSGESEGLPGRYISLDQGTEDSRTQSSKYVMGVIRDG